MATKREQHTLDPQLSWRLRSLAVKFKTRHHSLLDQAVEEYLTRNEGEVKQEGRNG